MKGRQATILLVEDDVREQEIVRRIVDQGATSARLQIVSSGQEALDFLRHEGAYASSKPAPPDLVLLDLNMPGLNGIETLKNIRSYPKTKLLPVIILTTSERESDIIKSYECGANSYITKPVEYEKFIRVIREVDQFWFDVASLPPSVG